jgi:hypothetical protein
VLWVGLCFSVDLGFVADLVDLSFITAFIADLGLITDLESNLSGSDFVGAFKADLAFGKLLLGLVVFDFFFEVSTFKELLGCAASGAFFFCNDIVEGFESRLAKEVGLKVKLKSGVGFLSSNSMGALEELPGSTCEDGKLVLSVTMKPGSFCLV